MPALRNFSERHFQVLGILIGVTIIFYIIARWNSQRLRVKKLGNRAPTVVYWAPFGKSQLPVWVCKR